MQPDDKTTVRVRMLVAVDATGAWVSTGAHDAGDARDWIMLDDLTAPITFHWIEADVPIPLATTIEGSVADAG